MQQTFAVVLPVFGLIGIGAAIAWTKLLSPSTSDGLADFVFVIAIPMLIFRIVATADLTGMSVWRLWLAFFASFSLCWIVGTMLIRRLFGRDARAGLVGGLAAGYGNTTLVGIPLVSAAFGGQGLVPMAFIVAVQLPVMMTAVAFLMVRAEALDHVGSGSAETTTLARSIVSNVIANPIVVGVLAGAVWRVAGIPLSGVVADLVNHLADVASTLALLALGMSLRKYGIRGHVSASAALALLKVLAMPALVLLLARIVGLPPVPTKVAVIAAACPTGVTPFLVAGRFRTGEGLASTTITLSTALAVVCVAFWLSVVGTH
jgi:malonate transporter and related proteins